MAPGQKETVSEWRSKGRSSGYPLAPPSSHHPKSPAWGNSQSQAAGSRRLQEGRVPRQALSGLTALANECCYSSRGQCVGIRDPCKITTTKTLLRLLSPRTTYFLSFSLKPGDAWYIHALRKQDYAAHPTVLGRRRSEV